MCSTHIDEKCSKLALEKINWPFENVQKCVDNSFINGYETDNSILSTMRSNWSKLGTHLNPSIVINDVIFRGQMNPDNVFEAICSGFKDMPNGCTKWMLKEGMIQDPRLLEGVSTHELLIIIAVLVFINLILICVYRSTLNKEIKKDMKVKVSSAVS